MVRDTDLRRRVSSQASKRVFSFSIIGDVIAELNRVTWPTREETTRLSIMVITVAVIVGIFLGIIDLGFSSIFNLDLIKVMNDPISAVRDIIPKLENQTPWQEISRKMVGQLETGACLETESLYLDITNTKGMPRHSH